MRKDIQMNIDLGELELGKNIPTFLASLIWIGEDDDYIYGECFETNPIRVEMLLGGFGLIIPQRDSLKQVKINFRWIDKQGTLHSTGYIDVFKYNTTDVLRAVDVPLVSEEPFDAGQRFAQQNADIFADDGSIWWQGFFKESGQWFNDSIWFDGFRFYDPNVDYYLLRVYLDPESESFSVWDGIIRDLMIDRSLEQNKFFLLVAGASNIYEFPINGVGLRDYLHADVMASGLSEKMREEFMLDKMIITKAEFEEETNAIAVDAQEREQ